MQWLKMESAAIHLYMIIIAVTNHYETEAAVSEIICIGSRRIGNCSSVQPDFKFLTTLPQDRNVDGTTLLLVNSTITLSEQILVIGYHHLHIQGRTNGTIINCLPNVGLRFTAVRNLVISKITFSSCGGIFNSTSTDQFGVIQIKAALYMSNCTNVDLDNIAANNSTGTGLVMYDCTGNINILNSNFTNNYLNETMMYMESGGGGLYIEFSECSPEWIQNCNSSNNQFNHNAVYYIDNCIFVNNSRTRATNKESIASVFADRTGHGGGGMSLWARGQSMNNSLVIHKCSFYGNKATYGGGLYFQFQQESYRQILLVVDTVFENNEAFNTGGGVDTGSIFTGTVFPKFITVNVENCWFLCNKANHGGGASVFLSLALGTDPVNKITFSKSTWRGNLAQFAYAINLRSLFLSHIRSYFTTKVLISDCDFIENKSTEKRSNTGIAAVHSRVFPIILSDNVMFESNEGSGIKLIDSSLIVVQNSTITFLKNIANFGGGISLIGFSSIVVHTHVIMNFIGNRAKFQGGAIYSYVIDEQPQSLCFIENELDIRYTPETTFINRPKFYFKDNKASHENSHSMYISSLVPCLWPCPPSRYFHNLTIDIFQECLGDFDFAEDDIDTQVTTSGSKLLLDDNFEEPLKFIPGKQTGLPFSIYDEFDKQTTETFLISIESNDSISLKYSYTAINLVRFTGQPGDKGILDLNSKNFQNLAIRLNVTLSECPPGFVISEQECVCSAQIQSAQYNSILHCDSENMITYISFGFWVGYSLQDGEKAGEDNLYTANCPLGYCNQIANENIAIKIHLPASQKLLDEYICGSRKRTGILCGDCIDNHSIYFHSWDYKCGHSDLCDYGILFYILSEILPVTLAFSIIIIKGIDFNSGEFNGLILFAQLTQSLSIKANGAIIYNNVEKAFYDLSGMFYGAFNLNFFKTDSLSFCIFKGANFLSIMLMEFVTLIYAFVLVILLVYLMRSRCCYKVHIICFRVGLTKTASLTKGLTAFFIICYSHATRLCYQVLNVGQLIGKGGKSLYPLRVLRMGSLEYFSGVHIPFAIGAIIILLTVVMIPPTLLLVYPILYKILPEKFQNKKPVRIILHRIEKYKPLFDSFQGCFRDEHRYFAGIHFLYRSAFVTTFAFINSRLVFFIVNETIAIIMLSLHLWMQPYKNARHNMIDGLLFFLMAIINMLTIWRFFLSYVQVRSSELVAVGITQLILLYLPLFLLVVFIFYRIVIWFWTKHKKQLTIENNVGLSDSDISLDTISNDYYRVFSDSRDWKESSNNE